MSEPPQLDLLSGVEVVGLLLDGEARVVPVVRAQAGVIAEAAGRIADRLAAGGRLMFLGAGTSGRIAVGEAVELPGTFGIDTARVLGRVAGGGPGALVGGDSDEDDTVAGVADLADLGPADCLVAVAASGRTPYTLAAAREARERRALVVAVVNAPGSPLAAAADLAIEVAPGEEVLRGSTRMNAGTAAKITLNVLSTTVMVQLGHVHGNLMVDVVGANIKLRDRMVGIVATITGESEARARAALAECHWHTRAAVLFLVTAVDPALARSIADAHPRLRDALAEAGRR